MSTFTPQYPDWEAKLRASFDRQGYMHYLGARLTRVEPGSVEIDLPFRRELTQQHGFFHAGATSAIADSAGGYAGFSIFPANSSVLTVEFKINLVAPARGERLRALGLVIKLGRTLTICDLKVFAISGEHEVLCATGLQTLICLNDRPDDG